MTRVNDGDRPVERVLALLENVREVENGWTALCPAHPDSNPSLSIAEAEDGRVLMKCFGGCETRDIVGAIGMTLSDLYRQPKGKRKRIVSTSGLTLEEYSKAKRLPIEFLQELGIGQIQLGGIPAVRMPYLDENGTVLATRMRISMDGNPKILWKTGDDPCPYGLWRLGDYSGRTITLVEGESCAQTLWLHNLPALGLPGAASWQQSWAQYLERFKRIYVLKEPDDGGEMLLRRLRDSPIRDRTFLIRLRGFKDASELFLSNPDEFETSWKEAKRSAVSWREFENEENSVARKMAWKACRDLARSEDILSLVVEDMEKRNVTGESRAKKLLYLNLITRFLDRPVSVVVTAPSSAGKSFVVESTLAYMPESACYALTAMSEKALAYSSEPLKNRFLVLYEGAALSGEFQNYLVRSLLSEGCIRYETVEKTDVGMQARLIEREGPTGLILTTTVVTLHPENATRLLCIPVSDSPAQTQRVLLALAKSANDTKQNSSPDMERWHALQDWLSLAEHRVYIPYADALASLIPPVAVRLRRDFGAILNLIKAHAILHQANRARDDEGRIVAELEDYRVVRELVNDLVSQGVEQTVPTTVRATVNAVFQACQLDAPPDSRPVSRLNAEPITASVAQVAKALSLERSSASRRINQALGLGYLKNLETKEGRPLRLVLGDSLPGERTIMPTPEELRGKWKATK